jgi:metal-dependent HD superfamily phosphatase/phosphodiesterase
MAGVEQEVAMDLYLDTKETELLAGLLERYLEDIRREIHHTDHASFRAALKSDETLMRKILGKLKAPAAMGM